MDNETQRQINRNIPIHMGKVTKISRRVLNGMFFGNLIVDIAAMAQDVSFHTVAQFVANMDMGRISVGRLGVFQTIPQNQKTIQVVILTRAGALGNLIPTITIYMLDRIKRIGGIRRSTRKGEEANSLGS